MNMFPRCDAELEDVPSLEGGMSVNRRCDGTLVPVKVFKSEGVYSRNEWLIDWRCTKCTRQM